MGIAVACGTPAAAGFLGSTYKDSKRKNMAMSCFGIGPPAGAASGFFMGGVCIVVLNWRAIHYFLSITFLLLSLLVAFNLPPDEKIDWAKAKQIFKGMDYIGAFISLSAFVLICFALTQVDATSKRWKTPYIIATLIIGIFLVGVFVVYESKVPTNPLMPMTMFASKNFNLSMMIASLSWMVFFGFLNYNATLFFEDIKNYKTMVVACCFLTQPIAGTLVNVFAGFTMHIIPGRIMMAIGCTGFLVACIIWATNSIKRNYFLGPFWAFCFTIIGAELIYNTANRCALSSVDRKYQSRAAGTFNTFCQLSSSVGLGLSTTVLASSFKYYGKPDQLDHIHEMFEGMKYVYYVAIGLTGLSLCLCPFLRLGVLGKTRNPQN
ncbi:unnamed protein product [Ambrosiozyma monospora]|uniref:Unnamed protein product n=1 Tax=Ambrosiozyma monospora TaxID=43982 RepID=A0ACB5TPQ5_AMBMO|nr:unnamed protein product [Ambrosiozyma monospora]